MGGGRGNRRRERLACSSGTRHVPFTRRQRTVQEQSANGCVDGVAERGELAFRQFGSSTWPVLRLRHLPSPHAIVFLSSGRSFAWSDAGGDGAPIGRTACAQPPRWRRGTGDRWADKPRSIDPLARIPVQRSVPTQHTRFTWSRTGSRSEFHGPAHSVPSPKNPLALPPSVGLYPKSVIGRVCSFVEEAVVVRDAAAARLVLCSPCG